MGRARDPMETRDPEQGGIVAQDRLKAYKALVDEAFRNKPLNLRQNTAATILAETHKHFTKKEFKELEKYVFEKLEK